MHTFICECMPFRMTFDASVHSICAYGSVYTSKHAYLRVNIFCWDIYQITISIKVKKTNKGILYILYNMTTCACICTYDLF